MESDIYTLKELKKNFPGKWVVLRNCVFDQDANLISGTFILAMDYKLECIFADQYRDGDYIMCIADKSWLGKRYTWEELEDKLPGANVVLKDVVNKDGEIEGILVDVITKEQMKRFSEDKNKRYDGLLCRTVKIFGMSGVLGW